MSKTAFTLAPNKFNLGYCWLFFIALAAVSVALLLWLLQGVEAKKLPAMLLLTSMIGLLAAQAGLIVLRHPYRLSLDHSTGDLLGTRPFGGPLRFNAAELQGFSKAHVWMDEEHHKVVILYFKDGRKIEFCEFIVRPIEALSFFLKQRNVPHFGEERSWFPFKKIKYRFDK